MLASIDGNIRTLFILAGVAALALGCSADAASPDAAAGGSIDARTTGPRADAMPFEFADAAVNEPDAAPGCVDSNEPNETSAAATSLSATPVSDDDGSGGTFSGVALGSDLDWYTYQGSDDLGNSVDPTIGVVPADKVEVCMFFDCVEDVEVSFTCPVGSAAASDGELTGCCSANGFTVGAFNCIGPISDDAHVYIRVKAVAVDVCESYAITYHY